jgi:hypothetical protein
MGIFFLTLLTFLVSIIGTITGFGMSTVMVPIVLLFLPLPETLLLVGIIHWFGDLWKMLLFKHGVEKKLLIYFGIPGVLAAVLGAMLTVRIPEKIGQEIVGVILIGYVTFQHFKPKFKLAPSSKTYIFGGLSSGLLAGLTGVGGGALRAVVLTALNIPKGIYLFTSGVLGALIDASRITTYLGSGVRIDSNLMWGLLAFIPASFLGAEVAKKIVDKIPQKGFRNVITVFLLLLGIKLTFFS